MTRVVVDASVLAAVTFGEPDADAWARRIEGAAVFAPSLLRYEMQSVAWKKCRLQPERAREIVTALDMALQPGRGITWFDPHPADVVLVANATGLTAYDASYLCVAGMLDADLVTGDTVLAGALDPFGGRPGA